MKILRNVRALATNAGYPWHIPFPSPGRVNSPNGVELLTFAFFGEAVCLIGLTDERHTKSRNTPKIKLSQHRETSRENRHLFWVLLSLGPGVLGWE